MFEMKVAKKLKLNNLIINARLKAESKPPRRDYQLSVNADLPSSISGKVHFRYIVMNCHSHKHKINSVCFILIDIVTLFRISLFDFPPSTTYFPNGCNGMPFCGA